MTPALDRLRRPFDHADVVAEQAEVGVGATVLVQAADNLEDTANMLGGARAQPQVAGVVAWVPLDDPAAAAGLLDGWHQTGEPVVGVRHLVRRAPTGTESGGEPPRQAPDPGTRLAAPGRPADGGRRGAQRDRQGLGAQHRGRP